MRSEKGSSRHSDAVPHQRDLVSRIKSLWQREQKPNAAAFLAKHSQVRANRGLALELAYEEYCIRRDTGESIQASTFCRQFPSISRSLHRQIEVEEYLRNHPEVVSPHADVPWPRRGDRLFGFLVVEEIGRGAFARAYLCAQTGIGNRQVVVKVSRGGALEADTMGTLDHPNIMPVYSVQEEESSGLTGICMPFVGRSTLHDVIDVAFGQDGHWPQTSSVILAGSRGLCNRNDRYHHVTLQHRIRRAAPYVTGVLHLCVQIADGLVHAHDRSIWHGDLKPSNIVMSVDAMPLIVDFNLAQNSHGAQNLVTGGTLPYMAPEQIRTVLLGADDNDRIDHRADIYSLGAILYEMLCGTPPFPVEAQDEVEPAALAGWMLDAQDQGLSEWPAQASSVDSQIRKLVSRCLAYDANDRPNDMREVAQEIRQFLGVPQRTLRLVRVHRRAALVAGLCVVSSLAGAGAYVAAGPNSRDRFLARGLRYYDQQNYMAAIDDFGRSITQDPEYVVSHVARACAAIQINEQNADTGWLDLAQKDLALAASRLTTLDVTKLTAYCLIKRDDLGMAKQLYYIALRADGSDDPAIHANYAACLLGITHKGPISVEAGSAAYNTAHDHLATAIRINPKLWQAHLSIALIDLAIHRQKGGSHLPLEGLDAIRKVIESNPKDAGTFYYAAKLAGIVGDVTNNETILREAIGYVDQASKLGYRLDVKFLRDNYPFYRLTRYQEFREIVRNPPAPRVVTVPDRFVRPEILDDLSVRMIEIESQTLR